MDLSQIDKSAILNPVINELGVIPPETKDRIIIQLSAQIDRIILEGYGKFTKDVLKSIAAMKGVVKDVRVNQDMVLSTIRDTRDDFDGKLTKMVQTLRAMEGMFHAKDSAVHESLKEVKTTQIAMASAVESTRANCEEMITLFKSMDTLVEQVREAKDELIKPVLTEEMLKEKSFGELIKMAKEKEMTIEPRTKKDELIQQILDTEKGDK